MKKAMLGMLAVLVLVSFSGVALAVAPSDPLGVQSPPSWWGDYTDPTYKYLQGSTEAANTGGTGGNQSGFLAFGFNNDQDLAKVKDVFLVAEIDTHSATVVVQWPGTLSWSYTPSGGGASPMTLVADNDPNDDHLELTVVGIDPQPDAETFTVQFTGLGLEEILTLNYDIRSICYEDDYVPEPAGLGLAGLALLAVRKRRS
jgi:hypothetical protein